MTPDVLSLEAPFGARDAHGMTALVEAIPDHIEQALARTESAPWQLPVRVPDLVAVGGMGGSAIAAEMTGGLWADTLPRPWLVVRDYRWPACVGPRSLAVLSSNSGNTEETLALERMAREQNVPVVGMTSGGELAARLHAANDHVQALPSGMPPRAAFFHAWVPMTRLVATLGWVADVGAAWREAAAITRGKLASLGAAVPESANPAKQLARELHGRLVLVYAASGPLAAVATRWRQQLNENAKMLGHSATVPELNHNEIVGWQAPTDLHRSIAVVVLRDREDSAECRTRLDLTAEYAARQGAAVHEFATTGESRIARLASLVQFGDHVSLYLALLGGVDPTDITSIDEFKRRLAEAAAPRRQ